MNPVSRAGEVDDIRAMVDETAAKAVKLNHARVQRLLGALDLTTETPLEGIHAVVADEVADLREGAAGALRALALSGAAGGWREQALDAIASEARFPRAELQQLARDLGAERDPSTAGERSAIASVLTAFADRHARFQKRVGYLVKPSTLDEIQKLDPKADSDQIYHFITYDFRAEQKLYATLFETRPVLVPHSGLFFHSTGEFTLRSVQRITDTVMFFSNMIEWGLESRRGRTAIERLNGIHGRYSVPNATFKFILGNIMFVPAIWNEKVGWRKFTKVERAGWYHTFARVGRAMYIQDVPDDPDEMYAWWVDYNEHKAHYSDVSRKGFDEALIQVLAAYPEDTRGFVLSATLAGMDDIYRSVLGFPKAPPDVVSTVKGVLYGLGYWGGLLPRIPWIRSLQTYPFNSRIEQIGVSERSKYMPPMAPPHGETLASAPNRGYPAGQRPLMAIDEIPEQELPLVEMSEVARHASESDGWLVVGEYVIDVTSFLDEHPGGRDMLTPYLGKDGTAAFDRIGHSTEAEILLSNFRIGRVHDASAARDADRATGAMKAVTRRAREAPDMARAKVGKTITPTNWTLALHEILVLVKDFEVANRRKRHGPIGRVAEFPIVLPSHPRGKRPKA